MLLLAGLLAAGVALVMLQVGERPDAHENAAASPGSHRAGRSTLSHGGPAAGAVPGNSERLPASGSHEPSTQFPPATKR
ncbi:MAG: hypothetical protein NTNFB01_34290 [Nitrospira sp.]